MRLISAPTIAGQFLLCRCCEVIASMTSEGGRVTIQRLGTLTGGRPGPARFSKSVSHGQVLYVAGQVPYDVTDMTYRGQTQQVLKLIENILSAGGSNKQSILKVSAFLRDIDAGADEYNAAWDAWADKQHLPVRTTIEAKLMSPDFLVEIDVVAAIP